MTRKQALEHTREILVAHGVEDASLECELLLRHALAISRVQLYQDFNSEISPQLAEIFWELIQRRLKGEPSAYITGHREFYGLDFVVDTRVLIPRPESELLVERALAMSQQRQLSAIAEIGTGCGAIAISLALNLPRTEIYAADVSTAVLAVARLNCQKHGVTDRVHLLQGDMLDPLPEAVDLIIANLPYVKESELSPQVGYEPRLALNGGVDGLDKMRHLAEQIGDKLRTGGALLLEIGQGQEQAVTALLRSRFSSVEIEVFPDLSGIERVVSLTVR